MLEVNYCGMCNNELWKCKHIIFKKYTSLVSDLFVKCIFIFIYLPSGKNGAHFTHETPSSISTSTWACWFLDLGCLPLNLDIQKHL